MSSARRSNRETTSFIRRLTNQKRRPGTDYCCFLLAATSLNVTAESVWMKS
jgi:hypothetical protein